MTILAYALALLVAALHVAFLVLEMFLWATPIGGKVFGLPEELRKASAPLAANQGLYNGFLAAGLVWGVAQGAEGAAVRIFFLACVVVAGVYGAATAKRSILFVQALPGALALAATLAAR